MICYRDMTFCTYYEGCKHVDTCSRPLTPEVKKAAEEWWGGSDGPIAVFLNQPLCYCSKDE